MLGSFCSYIADYQSNFNILSFLSFLNFLFFSNIDAH